MGKSITIVETDNGGREDGDKFLYDTSKTGYGLGVRGYAKKDKKISEAKM
jgi:hypothetical protein